jgi:iron complex outermembrane receptor protein
MRLQGGAMMLGVGANINREEYASKPGLFAQGKLADPVRRHSVRPRLGSDQRFGDLASALPYDAART